MARNAHTPCDHEGCELTPADGHPLFRVNAKGKPGVFMCAEHRRPKTED